ncbi:methyltransferase domain-containing protein [Methyloglobulus sp.]|uniref:methyltransferase domain-containing protein n=1 Tax=Methyloglobulus sp. TaxID=2518622 RepID=UPI003989E40C
MQQDNQESCSNPCNLCGGRGISVLANHSRSGKPLRTVICKDCGLVWTDPLPHNPKVFYEDDYRVAYKGTYTPKPKHILRAGKVALYRRKLLDKWLPQPLKILDVGTGGGEFAYLLQSLGHDVSGIEPNKGYAEYSKQEYGLKVQIGFIQDIQQPDQSFDLITIWHVLEHTENPHDVLVRLHSLLKPQGILVVEVPTIEATCQSPKSTFHEAHIFNFNLDTLRKLGEKVGFTELEHKVSADGGNITVFFQKSTPMAYLIKDKGLNIPGNAERIINIVNNHTACKHYLTAEPYRRFFCRMSRTISEQCMTANFVNGKKLLDRLYA